MASRTQPVTGTVDVALFTARRRELLVLLVPSESPKARERWSLPWAPLAAGTEPDAVAARVALAAAGTRASWLAQAGTFSNARRHPHAAAGISVGYAGIVPVKKAKGKPHGSWVSASKLPPLPPRQRAIVDAALAELRDAIERAPIAFHLLGEQFALGDLQSVYELLLGYPLHRASFRRSLQAAKLIVPTKEWRIEGRGRPARLFRYAPRRRHSSRAAARFELLG
jgi:8-oxo-dGTP diphosphatase